MFKCSKNRPEPVAVPPSASELRAELGAANELASALAGQSDKAHNELNEARTNYDAGIQAYALGTAREPGRAALDSALAKVESLRRCIQVNGNEVAKLTSALASAELAESATNEKGLVAALIADATAKLEAFRRAAIEAKNAEAELFAALFSPGLKREFSTPELNNRARFARFDLRDRTISAAQKTAFAISPDFETDGNINAASPEGHHRIVLAQYEQAATTGREIREAAVEAEAKEARKTRWNLFEWAFTGRKVPVDE